MILPFNKKSKTVRKCIPAAENPTNQKVPKVAKKARDKSTNGNNGAPAIAKAGADREPAGTDRGPAGGKEDAQGSGEGVAVEGDELVPREHGGGEGRIDKGKKLAREEKRTAVESLGSFEVVKIKRLGNETKYSRYAARQRHMKQEQSTQMLGQAYCLSINTT